MIVVLCIFFVIWNVNCFIAVGLRFIRMWYMH